MYNLKVVYESGAVRLYHVSRIEYQVVHNHYNLKDLIEAMDSRGQELVLPPFCGEIAHDLDIRKMIYVEFDDPGEPDCQRKKLLFPVCKKIYIMDGSKTIDTITI